ncbi:MAG: VTT domain-containing protein [bacterium]
MPDLVYILEKVGYIGIFGIIFLESFPMTFFLPGDSLLFSVGFLASVGVFSLPVLFVTIFIAGFFGYIFSYWLGQKIIKKFFNNPNSKIFNPKYVEYTREFFAKYGAKTIIIGRFVPIVRSFGPALAGVADVNFKKFIVLDLIGTIIWSVGITSAGFYLGRIMPGAEKYITHYILIIVFLSILPTIIEVLRRKKK